MSGKYRIVITKPAQKDKEKIKSFPALKNNVDRLLEILRENPYQSPLSCKIPDACKLPRRHYQRTAGRGSYGCLLQV